MIENIEKFHKDREYAVVHKNFEILYKSAMIEAKEFSWDNNIIYEAAFFIGRTHDRDMLNKILHEPYYALPPSQHQPKSFEKEECFYDLGNKYPFLEDEDLDFLEDMYCQSGTYKMINRMLFDGDELLSRKLARYNSDLLKIRHREFSKDFCIRIFNALIKKEQELDVQEALDDRAISLEDQRAKADLYGFNFEPSYAPVLVYNRISNEIQIDESDLSNFHLIPIANFHWVHITMKNAIDNFTNQFDHISELLFESVKMYNLSSEQLCMVGFHTSLYLLMERAICQEFFLSPSDSKIQNVRAAIAKEWLIFQNDKELL